MLFAMPTPRSLAPFLLLSTAAILAVVLTVAPSPVRASEGTGDPAAWWLANADVPALRELLRTGELASEELTRTAVDRIEALDGALRTVLALDPTALEQARALDRELARGGPRGPLHGIPVLVKDNIETLSQPTTAGSLALADNDTGRDAPLVARLRSAGAVILGKANLSEWANFRSLRSSSGWSALGGQTRNPHDPTRSPCGSSSGSAAAVAAGLLPLAVGTETNGSIVCPASANGVVGIKPTVGLVSRTHVVPISHTQDTAGPMAKTVAGAVALLEAMIGPDPADPATAAVPREHFGRDLSAHLQPDGLRGKRIGVVRSAAGFHAEVDRLFDSAVEELRDGGATVVDGLELERPDGFSEASFAVLLNEFRHDLDAYLAGLPDERLAGLNLEKLIAFNEEHAAEEMPWFGQEIFERAAETEGPGSESYREALALVRKATRDDGIDRLVAEHELDALVAPTGAPAWKIDLIDGDHFLGGSSTFPAVAGYPNITVPMGAVHGLPVGLSIFGPAFSEPTLIEIASGYERRRGSPSLHRSFTPSP